MTGPAGEPLGPPRVQLDGDAAARPEGLERALSRAGFRLVGASASENGGHELPADVLLTTLPDAEPTRLRAALARPREEPPRIVVFAVADPDAPAAALALGAADALAAPVHLPELCARLLARVRDRQYPAATAHELGVRETLRDFVQEARGGLHPDEVAVALLRRLARALGLSHCSLVVTRPGDEEGRVVEGLQNDQSGRDRLELARYPEIGDAVRSRRTLTMTDGDLDVASRPTFLVLPVVLDDTVAGVLLMRGADAVPVLSAAQLGLAEHLAVEAARSLVDGRGATGGPALPPPAALDRRLQEELERARRYSLSFSLVLLHPESDGTLDEPGLETVPRRRDELLGRIRRELRLPDFVATYGDGELVLVLPETAADGARRWIVRIRERVAGVAAGIAAYPHPAVTVPDDLLALVEAALRRGRAQTVERIGVAE